MPKKFTGENSKAVAAKARKVAARDAETAKKQKELEDSYWADDDKNAKKRQQKKEEQERRKQEALSKKAEAKAQLELEVESATKLGKQPLAKVSRAQINAETEKRNAAAIVTAKLAEKKVIEPAPLVENLNRLLPDKEDIAETIDEAIAMFDAMNTGGVDKHPEKRMKACYAAFVQKWLPHFKEKNPTLRLSQVKQLIFKEWQKSEENPMNQPKETK